MMCGSWDMEHDRQFFVILDYFLPFYPKQPQKLWKIKKNSWKYYHFTYVYHEWQPYDVWLLWYREWQTEFFNILDHFLPFHLPPPLTTRKINILKNWKTLLKILSLFTSLPKIMIICYTVPEIWQVMDVIIFLILGYFFPFYLCNSPKIKN